MKKLQSQNIRIPKIKISKTIAMIIFAVVIVVCVAGYGLMGYAVMDEQSKQDDLETAIDKAKDEWQIIKDRPVEDLDQLLEQTRDELALEQSLFKNDLSSNNVMEILLQAANECNVQILPLGGFSPADIEQIDGNDYFKVKFDLSPEGTLPNVLRFVDKLENGTIGDDQYATIVVEEVSISGQGSQWSVNLNGYLYSKPGPAEPTESGTPTV